MSNDALTSPQVPSPVDRAWTLRDRDREQSRALLDEGLADALQPQADTLRAYLAWREGAHDQALIWADRAIGGLSARPPSVWLARALNVRGCLLSDLGDALGASGALEAQIALSRELGDAREEATGLHDLGVLHLYRDPQRAGTYLLAARELAQRSDNGELLAYITFNTGFVHLHAQDLTAAQDNFQEALGRAREEGLGHLEVVALAQLGGLALRGGRRAEAEGLLRAALDRRDPQESLNDDVLLPFSRLLLDTDRTDEALTFLRGHLDTARQAGARPLEQQLHAVLAEVHEQRGDPASALTHLKETLRLHRELHAEHQERQVRALEVLYRTGLAQREAATARARNAELDAAIERLAQLHQQAQQLSLTDELTGSWNRRFLITTGSELAASASPERPLSLAVIDLDHFKRVNDTHGHGGGDAVLREFADLLRRCVRLGDFVVRSGGEEFVVLFPATSAPDAAAVMERMRASLNTRSWQGLPDGERLTFTAGVAACEDGQLLDTLRRADKLLYGGKAEGRNTVRV